MPVHTHADLEGYTFRQYVTEFNKVYATASEMRDREALFNTTLAKVLQWNRQYRAGQQKWFAAVNRFTDVTKEEMKRFKGFDLHRSLSAARARAPSAAPIDLKYTDLPATVDWRTQGVVTDVKVRRVMVGVPHGF
jgi:hypothetical protein